MSKLFSVMFLFLALTLLTFVVLVISEPEHGGGFKHKDSDYYYAISSLHIDPVFRINCSDANLTTHITLPTSACEGCCDVWDKRQLDYFIICTTYDGVQKRVMDHCGAVSAKV